MKYYCALCDVRCERPFAERSEFDKHVKEDIERFTRETSLLSCEYCKALGEYGAEARATFFPRSRKAEFIEHRRAHAERLAFLDGELAHYDGERLHPLTGEEPVNAKGLYWCAPCRKGGLNLAFSTREALGRHQREVHSVKRKRI